MKREWFCLCLKKMKRSRELCLWKKVVLTKFTIFMLFIPTLLVRMIMPRTMLSSMPQMHSYLNR